MESNVSEHVVTGKRWCSRCSTNKQEDDFYRTHSWCKDCRRAYHRQYRAVNASRIAANQVGYQANRQQRLIDELRRAKDKPCLDCGVSYPRRVMNLHHRDPAEKTFAVSQLHNFGSVKALRLEIAKCDVLCANCHALRHIEEGEE